jgi:D-alanine transaminase
MPLPAYVSRNGVLIPPVEASVSVFNPALYGAYGVYESMQVERGIVFAVHAHLQRLARSAQIIQLPLPAGSATFERWIREVLAANSAGSCTLRLFVLDTGNGGETAAYIWPQPDPVHPVAAHTAGASAITFEGRRFLPQAKSLNNLASTMARRRAQAAGVHEGLLHHDGFLTEGANSNLFAVMDGVVLTPSAEDVLSGVTRDILIKLAAQHHVDLHEGHLELAAVLRWQECFITSTSRHVMPITSIDGRPVGDGRVGPVTRRLSEIFEKHFVERMAYEHDESPAGSSR